ncbi:MAG TPA: purine nucleoside permease, partial [Opitutaceae bacterium]
MTRILRLLALALPLSSSLLAAEPIPVRVAVVVTFEVGEDRGDRPGEFQFWCERENWTRKIDVPGV